jgi:hypothetical protein
VQGQVMAFVDDALVRSDAGNFYFQMKNAESLSWTSGGHPLHSDFASQWRLGQHLKEHNVTTHLVVPSEKLRDEMIASLPATISHHTTVEFFPYCGGSASRQILENLHLRANLSLIAKVADAQLDVLEAVLGVLLVTIAEHEEGARVDEFVAYANKIHPNQLRASSEVALPALRPEFVAILSKIPGLGYHVERGFFGWAAFGTSGVLGFDCSDNKFMQFQEIVVAKDPKTFEGFEELLP